MTMRSPVRVALVGAGSMGSLHARVVAQSDQTELAAVVDPDETLGRAVADRFGTRWQPELDNVADVDAVIVAATTEAHESLAYAVLSRDLPLLIEKPVTGNLETSAAIVELSRQRDVPLMCGLLERYNPAVLTALPMVDAPIHIRAQRHSPYAPRIKTGVAWDLLIHDVDLAMRFLPREVIGIETVSSRFHPASLPEAEDVVEVAIRFDTGAIASFSASRIGQRKVRSLAVYDLDKLVEIDLLRRDITVYRHVAEQSTQEGRGYRQQTVIEIPELVTSREPLAAQLDRFVRVVRGEADADEERDSILPSHRVVEEVKRSARLRAASA